MNLLEINQRKFHTKDQVLLLRTSDTQNMLDKHLCRNGKMVVLTCLKKL